MPADPAADGERLLSGHAGLMLVTLLTVSLSSTVGRLVVSPMLPVVIDDLGITPAMAGLALTLMWALTALGQLPGGQLADQLSQRTVLVVGVGGLAAGFVILMGATSYALFLVGAAIVGAGAGLFLPAKFLAITDLFERRRGQAFGLDSAAVEFGGVLAAGLAVLVLSVATWRAAFGPVAAALLVVLLVLHRSAPGDYGVSGASLDVRTTAGRLVGSGELRRLVLLFSLFSFVWQGVTSFLPAYLQATKGFGPATASNAFAAMFVVAAVTSPFVGALGDRFGHSRVAIGPPVVGLAGLSLLVWTDGGWPVFAGVAVLAAGLGSFWPVAYAHLMDALPDGNLGADLGGVRMVFLGVGSLGPTYVGVLAGLAGYEAAFAGFLVCLLACIAITVGVARDDRLGRWA